MINREKLKEYIEAFRKSPNISVELLNEIKAKLECVELELMRLQFMVIEISKALGVETKN